VFLLSDLQPLLPRVVRIRSQPFPARPLRSFA